MSYNVVSCRVLMIDLCFGCLLAHGRLIVVVPRFSYQEAIRLYETEEAYKGLPFTDDVLATLNYHTSVSKSVTLHGMCRVWAKELMLRAVIGSRDSRDTAPSAVAEESSYLVFVLLVQRGVQVQVWGLQCHTHTR